MGAVLAATEVALLVFAGPCALLGLWLLFDDVSDESRAADHGGASMPDKPRSA